MTDNSGNYRKVLQFMFAKGCVKHSEFVAFLESLKGENASQSQMSDDTVFAAVATLNKRLTKYNMMLRAAADDVSHEVFYCLISTVDNAITHQASHHTPKEFDYFRLVWQAITQNGETSLEAIKELGKQNKVNHSSQLLQEWHQKRWLVIEGNSIRLGVRSKAELDVLEMQDRSSMSMDTSR